MTFYIVPYVHMSCCMHCFLARNANTVFVSGVYVTLFIVAQINRLILTWQKMLFKQASCFIIVLLITNTMIASVEILLIHYIHHLVLCTQVTDRITARICKPIHRYSSRPRTKSCEPKIVTENHSEDVFVHGTWRGPVNVCLHTVRGCSIFVLLLDSRHESGASRTKETN